MLPNIISQINNIGLFRIKNVVIMTNPDSATIEKLEDEIKRNYRVHIFVTSPLVFNDKWEQAMDKLTDWANYYIHIPKRVKDIKVIADDYVSRLSEHKVIKTILEKDGPKFNCAQIGHKKIPICIDYTPRGIYINFRIGFTNYNNYYYSDGALTTSPMCIRPDLFKNEIIENFKKACPEGILKAFKDDKDIWDYINQNAEWSAKED